MLRNYVRIAVRSLLRDRHYSVVNIIGLSLSISCSLVIFLLVKHELSYDAFQAKADRLYRVTRHVNADQGTEFNANSPLPLATALRGNFSGIEQVVQVFYKREGIVTLTDGAVKYPVKHYVFADPQVLHVFSFEWVAGNRARALTEPNTVVLTEGLANTYFKGSSALGKTFTLNGKLPLKVTGIVKDLPPTNHLPCDMVISFASFKSFTGYDMNNWVWQFGGNYTYVLLHDGYAPATAERQVNQVIRSKYLAAQNAQKESFHLQPLGTIHFDQQYGNNVEVPSVKESIWTLSAIAVFVIVVTCINYINFTVVQSLKRARETGIQKALGATRRQLVYRYLSETIVITCTAIPVAVLVAWLVLPSVSNYLEIPLRLDLVGNWFVPAFLLVLTLLISLLAGLYPSFVLSKFSPAAVLSQGGRSAAWSGLLSRKTFMVIQFTIAQALIICTLIVTAQVNFVSRQQLGFTSDNIVTFLLPNNDKSKIEVLRGKLLQHPSIPAVSYGSAAAASNHSSYTDFFTNDPLSEAHFITELKSVDGEYMKLYGFRLLAGEAITRVHESDSVPVYVVNEAVVKKLGYQTPQEAVGNPLKLWGTPKGTIIGVVENFHNESKYSEIRPCVLTYNAGNFYEASVQVLPGKPEQTLDYIQQQWEQIFPDELYAYQFLNDFIHRMYQRENKVLQSLRIFSLIAIFISYLGLHNLVSLIALQRTRELAIRKVLGASPFAIFRLLGKEFILTALLAFGAATAFSYYLMHDWLTNFVYRIDLGPFFFLATGLVSALVIGAVVGYRSLRMGTANLADTLRAD